MDGYYRLSTDTVGSLSGPTFSAAAKFAPGKPVLIAETSAAPQAGKARPKVHNESYAEFIVVCLSE
jgi:hypothetical protein